MNPPGQRRVPPQALIISLGVLLIPVTTTLLAPESQEALGLHIWLTALLPAFLLAFYRGLRGVATALAAAMAVLSGTQALLVLTGGSLPPFSMMLGLVAAMVGISIALAVLTDVLHRERDRAAEAALRDPLTGLANRVRAEVMLDAEFAAATRGRRLVVIVFDVDGLGQVNEAYGEAEADEALRALGRVLQANTRQKDLVARIGANRFLAVLTDNEPEATLVYAERVRRELRDMRFPWGITTVSAGIAGFEPGMGTWEVLVAAAETALRDAKAAGGDRIAAAARHGADRNVGRLVRGTGPAGSGSGEHLVVMDDDPDVVRTLSATLVGAGYRVEGMGDPEALIRRWQDGAIRMDVLITDIMMPAMNGLLLVDRLCAVKPVRVIYISGYLHGEVGWAGMPGEVVGILAKPIDMGELLGTVRAVLDKNGK